MHVCVNFFLLSVLKSYNGLDESFALTIICKNIDALCWIHCSRGITPFINYKKWNDVKRMLEVGSGVSTAIKKRWRREIRTKHKSNGWKSLKYGEFWNQHRFRYWSLYARVRTNTFNFQSSGKCAHLYRKRTQHICTKCQTESKKRETGRERNKVEQQHAAS